MIALLLAACTADAPPVVPVCDDAWDSFAAGFLRTWCTSCHSSTLPVDLRYGAPVGMDFDTLDGTKAHAAEVLDTATGEAPRMPPAGGPDAADRQRLAAWLRCGAAGTETPTAPYCSGDEVVVSSVSVQTTADVADLCATSVIVSGDVTVAGGLTIGCLCAVDGTLTLTEGAVSLPSLTSVTADLWLTERASGVSAPALVEIGGQVIAEAVPQLQHVRLPALATVGGAITFEDAPLLEILDLSRLATVGGTLRIERAGVAVVLGQGDSLLEIGGDLVLRNLPHYIGGEGFGNLASVVGTVEIAENPVLPRLRAFTVLQSARSVVIRDNASLAYLDGFDRLEVLTHDLLVLRNQALIGEDAFVGLDRVGGLLEVSDNPVLGALDGLARPIHAGVIVVQRNAGLTSVPLTRLQSSGSVELVDLPSLSDLTLGGNLLGSLAGPLRIERTGLSDVAAGALRTVGSLTLSANPLLGGLDGLSTLETVEGDLALIDNVQLPTAVATTFAAGLGVGGTVTISGNGP